ncbi:MAG TPA: (deoxy)nucleoside triphosphate pyrophosphohydrolase [Steroidobacteraceae bacterium]|nr:(deoxy)nucleoside triphosphate pyrophosphohydrolase [Steroidobacteraceae bacterium]
MRTAIHVVAGALFDNAGRVLIAQRPTGKHMAGGWEFPGGKIANNESPFAGLVRELKEELNIGVIAAEPVIAYIHQYADRDVHLDLWRVTRYEGIPVSAEGQAIKWVSLDELNYIGLLEADQPMIEPLKKSLRSQR